MKKWKILVPCVFTTCAAVAPIVSCKNADTTRHYLVFNGLRKRYSGSEDKGGKSQIVSLYDYRDGYYYDVTDDAKITTDCDAISYDKETKTLYWEKGTPAGQYNFNVNAKVNGSTISYSSTLTVAPLRGELAIYNVPSQIAHGIVGQPGGITTNVLQAKYADPYTGDITDVSDEAKFVCNRKGVTVNENKMIVWDASLSAGTYNIKVSAVYKEVTAYKYFTLVINERTAEFNIQNFPSEVNFVVGQPSYFDQQINVLYKRPDMPITEDITDSVYVAFPFHSYLSFIDGYITFDGTTDTITGDEVTVEFSYDGLVFATKTLTLNVLPREENIAINFQQEYLTGEVGKGGMSWTIGVDYLPTDTWLTTDVTNSCTFACTSTATDDVWFDEQEHKVAWGDELDMGTYPLTITATYTYENTTLTTSYDTILYIYPREESVACEPSSIAITPHSSGSQQLSFSYLSPYTWEPIEIEANDITVNYLPNGVYFDKATMTLGWYDIAFDYDYAWFTVRHAGYEYSLYVPMAIQLNFNNVTWEQLSTIASYGSDAIHAVFKTNCDENVDYPGTLIGLSKNMPIGDSNYLATIVDEDYDTLSSSPYSEKACLTFMIEMPDKSSTFNNHEQYASSFWSDCKLHGFLNQEIYNLIDISIRKCIKKVKKTTYNERNEAYSSEDYFFIPSLRELDFHERDIEDYEPYEYFKENRSSKLMKSSDSIWLRSPWTSAFAEKIYYLHWSLSQLKPDVSNVWDEERQIVAMFCI